MEEGPITTIFNKDIHALTDEDISHYFNSERETNTIEFKAYMDDQKPGTTKESRDNDKIDSILESICAFLTAPI